jgi:exosome complex RNA-binding protein Rrp42 (RNase PH superfamily)
MSLFEVKFIVDGVEDNLRLDGRTRLDVRPISSLRYNILPNANASAHLVLGQTSAVAAVNLQIVSPPGPAEPALNFLSCSVQW